MKTKQVEGRFDKGAFEYCVRLKEVRLPESLKCIGHHTFSHCKSLVHISIPSGVQEMGRCAFDSCESLSSVVIPEGVVELSSVTFNSCYSLRSVTLPKSLRKIGECCFTACASLRNLNSSDITGVTHIGENAFSHCVSLKSFKVPPLLKVIERCTFYECKSLGSIELPPNLERIKGWAFSYCQNPYLSIFVPPTVSFLENDALSGCRVRLPPELSILSAGGNSRRGMLNDVQEITVSCRANLALLISTLRTKKHLELQPFLVFKFLFNDHVLEDFFKVTMTPDEVKGTTPEIVRSLVDAGFKEKVLEFKSAYATVLTSCGSCGPSLPSEMLYVLLPFLYGDDFEEGTLADIVRIVGEEIVGEGRERIRGGEGEGEGRNKRAKVGF